jgi:hypothetical protein
MNALKRNLDVPAAKISAAVCLSFFQVVKGLSPQKKTIEKVIGEGGYSRMGGQRIEAGGRLSEVGDQASNS